MKKEQKQNGGYLWLTKCNVKEICNANRDTLDQLAYQEQDVRNESVVFGGR